MGLSFFGPFKGPLAFFFFPASAAAFTGTFDFFIALGMLPLKTNISLWHRCKAIYTRFVMVENQAAVEKLLATECRQAGSALSTH